METNFSFYHKYQTWFVVDCFVGLKHHIIINLHHPPTTDIYKISDIQQSINCREKKTFFDIDSAKTKHCSEYQITKCPNIKGHMEMTIVLSSWGLLIVSG